MKKVTALFVAALIALFALQIYAVPATDTLDITVYKASVKPVIDGKLSKDEWGDAVMYEEAGVGYTYFPDEDGGISDQAVKATIYMLWDEDGLYVAAYVLDPTHYNQYYNLDIWNGDAFEFDSNFNPDDYTDRNRQCFGINNDGDVYGGSYKVASGVDWGENTEIEYSEYTATVDGGVTVYEFFVAWENFCPDGSAFAVAGNVFRGNVQFHLAYDGDYVGCQRYVKQDGDTFIYPNFILADTKAAEPAVTEAEPEAAAEQPAEAAAEQPAVTEPAVEQPAAAAPITADAVSIACLTAICAAAVLAVIKKSRLG